MSEALKLDPEVLSMVMDTIDKLERDRITIEDKLNMDEKGEFPMALIRFMLSPEIALHLIFIDEEYGGLGAGSAEIALVSERMAKMDLGIATSFLAICLGMDPIRVGATPEQKEKYIGRIAEQGLIVAYGATEPEAGSDLFSLKTRAEKVLDENGEIKGYKLDGQKQFITNGGVADLYTILANTPEGPSFFIVEAGAEGLTPGKHEDKHGIRASDTCPLMIEDLYIPREDLVGGVEGKGLKQAYEVFGYTRLMVATFGLGAGMAALEKTIGYAKERVQSGTKLAEKQGYTHQLLVPNAVRLEAARAYIEQTAKLIDSGKEDQGVEGSIAKYFATEAGDAMANDAIQGLGGYGYIREYEVEKIKRDVKITTIFEGTSEVQRNIIHVFRMRETVRSKGRFYLDKAEVLEALTGDCGSKMLAEAIRIMNEVIMAARKTKLNRSQYITFLLADMMTWCEVGESFCRKTAEYRGGNRSPEFMKAAARLFSREAVLKVYENSIKVARGYDQHLEQVMESLKTIDLGLVMQDNLKDMDLIAEELVR